jgi:hypothetical protein
LTAVLYNAALFFGDTLSIKIIYILCRLFLSSLVNCHIYCLFCESRLNIQLTTDEYGNQSGNATLHVSYIPHLLIQPAALMHLLNNYTIFDGGKWMVLKGSDNEGVLKSSLMRNMFHV